MDEWEQRIPEQFSSPSAARFKSWTRGTKINLARAEIRDLEYQHLKQQLASQNKAKITSRKDIKPGGPGAEANVIRERQRLRDEKIKEKEDRKRTRALRIALNTAKRAHHQAGVNARRAERERKKKIQEL
jgi:hypothetical protein